MSLKVHLLHIHLEFFRDNSVYRGEEQGEGFHHDLKEINRKTLNK